MRIVAQPHHDDCKITIISWNQKYLVKYERYGLEQNYKISEMDTTGLDEVQEMALEQKFIQKVLDRFDNMNQEWSSLFA